MATPKKNYYSIYLPCKPYIRKYAEALHGSPVHIAARNRSSLGHFVEACLVKERYTNRNFTDSFIHRNLTDKLHLQISTWAFDHIGFDFPNDKIIELNQFLEVRFEEHMHQWVDVRAMKKGDRRPLIERFAENYGIYLDDDLNGEYKADISLEALVQTEYRMRMAILKRKEELTAAKNLKVAA